MHAALPSEPVHRALYNQEFEIRNALKRFSEHNTFSLEGIDERRTNQKQFLADNLVATSPTAFHESWRLIDFERRSAACFREQVRSRVWAFGDVFSSFVQECRHVWWVTFADVSDQRRLGRLHKFSPVRFRRRINNALNALAIENPDLRALGVVEVSASTTPSGLVFEPHAHLLVADVDADLLRARLHALVRAKVKDTHPVRIEQIDSVASLGRTLSYCFKFLPEQRPTSLHKGTRSRGYDNLMTGAALAEWYRWLAAYRASDLLIHTGQSPSFIADMKSREMQPLIDSLIQGSRLMPQEVDNGAVREAGT